MTTRPVEILRETLTDPARGGWLAPRSWPRGMGGAGVLATVAGVALLVVTLAAGWLRRHTEVVRPDQIADLPTWSVPVLWLGILTALALAWNALFHASRPVQVVLGLLLAGVMGTGSATPGAAPRVCVGLSLALLVLMAVWRRRREWAAWEFLVALAASGLALVGPLVVARSAQQFGFDLRLTMVLSAHQSVWPLSLPILVMAGFAPAQVALQLASNAVLAGRAARPTSGRTALAAVVVVASIVLTAVLLVRNPPGRGAWLASAGILLLCLVVALVVPRGARRGAGTSADEEWLPWTYPLAAAITASLWAPALLAGVATVAWVAGWEAPQRAVVWAYSQLAGSLTQGGLGAVAGVVAIAVAVRTRRTAVVPALAAFTVVMALLAAPALDGGRIVLELPDAALVAVALVLAGVVALLRPSRVLRLVLVPAACLLYSARFVLDEPWAWIFGVGSTATLVLGLAWRAFTESEATRPDGRWLPRSSRLLVHFANVLIGAVSLAIAALTVPARQGFDPGVVGDGALGVPLFVAVVVGALADALRAREP